MVNWKPRGFTQILKNTGCDSCTRTPQLNWGTELTED
jgi:hypothetical protein